MRRSQHSEPLRAHGTKEKPALACSHARAALQAAQKPAHLLHEQFRSERS